jgi:hypothetical protein
LHQGKPASFNYLSFVLESHMRKIILSAVLLAASVAHAQTTYTAADVAKHATAADCWMILNTSKVYNLSAYTAGHPGGQGSISAYCGKNGDPGFASVHHSAGAVAAQVPYLIGSLGTAPPPAPITVKISPPNATIALHATEQFIGTVTGSNTGMTWTVAPATLGSIGANGLFTGTTAGQGTVTVASQQDGTKTASALITVNPATPPPPPTTIAVTVTPSALTMNAGASHTFTANVTNSTQGVMWTASAALGKITANGLLTASTVPATGKVTATSVQDPTKFASVQVTLTSAVVPPPPPTTCPPGGGGGDDGGGQHHHDD